MISIFFPIVFLDGDTAKLFKELAITIIGAFFNDYFVNIDNLRHSKLLTVKNIKTSSEIENKYISALTYLLKKKYFFFSIIPIIIFLVTIIF